MAIQRRHVVRAEDLPDLTRCVVNQDVPGGGVSPPPARHRIQAQPEQHRHSQDAVDQRHPPNGSQDRIAQRSPSTGFTGRKG